MCYCYCNVSFAVTGTELVRSKNILIINTEAFIIVSLLKEAEYCYA